MQIRVGNYGYPRFLSHRVTAKTRRTQRSARNKYVSSWRSLCGLRVFAVYSLSLFVFLGVVTLLGSGCEPGPVQLYLHFSKFTVLF